MKRGLCIFILGLMLISSVYAAGGGGGGSSSSSSRSTTTVQKVAVMDCERNETMRERIKCRLLNSNEANETATTEESCRGLANRESCQNLYRISAICYNKTGREKGMCFREKAGESKRYYIVLLLYDLQERVEEKYENGKITVGEASDLIDAIINTKKTILNSGSREEIKDKMQELRKKWTEIMQ